MRYIIILIAAVLLGGCVTPSGAKGGAGVGMRQAGVATQSKADHAEFAGHVVFHGDVVVHGGGALAIGSIGGQSSAISDVYQEAGKAVETLKGSAATAVSGQGTADAEGAPVDQRETAADTPVADTPRPANQLDPQTDPEPDFPEE